MSSRARRRVFTILFSAAFALMLAAQAARAQCRGNQMGGSQQPQNALRTAFLQSGGGQNSLMTGLQQQLAQQSLLTALQQQLAPQSILTGMQQQNGLLTPSQQDNLLLGLETQEDTVLSVFQEPAGERGASAPRYAQQRARQQQIDASLRRQQNSLQTALKKTTTLLSAAQRRGDSSDLVSALQEQRETLQSALKQTKALRASLQR